ncbi:hypothetical protein BDZ89DRAFT_1067470 [Hymenopellis radicata]|nr:hypothetical protein BDZ89DRAFT_1067470 [Hymenopellis radicata]
MGVPWAFLRAVRILWRNFGLGPVIRDPVIAIITSHRVKATQKTRKTPATEPYNSVEIEDESDYDQDQPPAKRIKTGAVKGPTKRKGKGKQTGAFQQLPVELILEIISYLPPKNLVALMFLSRGFYDMLSNDSPASLKMWKNSRMNEIVAVPAPPHELTELQWARFLYETHCQCCGSTRAKLTHLFSLRKRVCSKCMSANLMRGSDRPNALLKKYPFASVNALALVLPSDKDISGNVLLQEGYVHSHYHWESHIPVMLRRLGEEYPDVYFGEVHPSESDSYQTFYNEESDRIQTALAHAKTCCIWEKKMAATSELRRPAR